jgi:hypothetical protein
MQKHAAIRSSATRHGFKPAILPSKLSTSSLAHYSPQISTPCSTRAVSHGFGQQATRQTGTSRVSSVVININAGSTGKGILIGILSAFGSAGIAVLVLAIFFFFRYTSRGRIILDRIGRPGEYDDEQAFAREEADALETMDELQRIEYLRAKGELIGVSIEI